MMLLYPDGCVGGQCVVVLVKGSEGKVADSLPVLCSYHQGIKNARGLTEPQLFTDMLASYFRREQAVELVRQTLPPALRDKVSVRLNPDGSHTVVSGASPAVRAQLAAAVAARLGAIGNQPDGFSDVDVE